MYCHGKCLLINRHVTISLKLYAFSFVSFLIGISFIAIFHNFSHTPQRHFFSSSIKQEEKMKNKNCESVFHNNLFGAKWHKSRPRPFPVLFTTFSRSWNGTMWRKNERKFSWLILPNHSYTSIDGDNYSPVSKLDNPTHVLPILCLNIIIAFSIWIFWHFQS